MTVLDLAVITLIQNTFLKQIQNSFGTAIHYANNLLVIFAAIELAIFGFLWALSSDSSLGNAFLKLLKIGLIFFILKEYTHLLNVLFKSFVHIAGDVGNETAEKTYVNNPALFWQYAYKTGVALIQNATQSNSIGFVFTQLSLGFGILLVFGLLGIQLLIYYIGFYLVAFVALIFIPISVLSSTGGILHKSIYSILQAGIRLMVALIIAAIAVAIWQNFNLDNATTDISSTLSTTLGLLFSGLIFLALARYLPPLAADTIGSIINTTSLERESSTAVVAAPAVSVHADSSPVFVNVMQAATQIDAQQSLSPAMMTSSQSLSSENTSMASSLAPSSGASVQVTTESRNNGSLGPQSSSRLSDAADFRSKALNRNLNELNKNLQSLSQKDKP